MADSSGVAGNKATPVPKSTSSSPSTNNRLNTTSWLLLLGAALTALSGFVLFTFVQPEVELSDFDARLDRILATTPLIDGHNDLPYLLRIELLNKIYDSDFFTFWDGKPWRRDHI